GRVVRTVEKAGERAVRPRRDAGPAAAGTYAHDVVGRGAAHGLVDHGTALVVVPEVHVPLEHPVRVQQLARGDVDDEQEPGRGREERGAHTALVGGQVDDHGHGVLVVAPLVAGHDLVEPPQRAGGGVDAYEASCVEVGGDGRVAVVTARVEVVGGDRLAGAEHDHIGDGVVGPHVPRRTAPDAVA